MHNYNCMYSAEWKKRNEKKVKCLLTVCVCPSRGNQAALVQEALKALLVSASRGKRYENVPLFTFVHVAAAVDA